MRLHMVRDGDDSPVALFFTGTELAFATSEGSRRGKARVGDDLRWTELTIYRTEGGSYVYERIGRSDVYHVGCHNGIPMLASTLDDERRPCTTCNPPARKNLDRNSIVTAETDRFSGHIVDTAEDLVQLCYGRTGTGMRYLTDVARRVLTEASKLDPEIRNAFTNQMVA